ncbi:unnamed protein product [Rotaria socialis]|uniref:Uncharacterized protein n=3 Tax=Rotaria socialis TaxID=392032 RepID=A0A817Z5N1_9BILA|nr:unnamed protein product [Rotaria socialis]
MHSDDLQQSSLSQAHGSKDNLQLNRINPASSTQIRTEDEFGSGIDTFNLPDFRARFPLGSRGTNDASIISGGNSLDTITTAELPAHNHDQGSLQTQNHGAHTHSYSDPVQSWWSYRYGTLRYWQFRNDKL